MTRRPGDTEPLPPAPTGEDDVDIHPGYTPDAFKKRTAQSHGEAAAAFQSDARSPAKGGDTQDLKPPVLIDVTKEEGFSGDEIRKLVAEMEVERQRGRKTVVVEKAPPVVPVVRPRRFLLLALLGLALVGVAVVIAITAAHRTNATTPSDAPTASASAVATQTPPSATSAVLPIETSASSSPSASAVAPTAPVTTASAPSIRVSASSHAVASSTPTAHASSTPSASASHHATDVPSGAL